MDWNGESSWAPFASGERTSRGRGIKLRLEADLDSKCSLVPVAPVLRRGDDGKEQASHFFMAAQLASPGGQRCAGDDVELQA